MTVELVGVCEYPSAGRQWWRPDGTLLKDAPYDQLAGPASVDSRHKTFEFVVRTEGATGRQARLEAPQSPYPTNSGTPLDKNGNTLDDLVTVSAVIPTPPNTTTVRFGVPAGADVWRTVWSFHSEQWRSSAIGRFVFHEPYEKDGETVVIVAHAKSPEVDKTRVVAFDKSDKMHMAGMTTFGVKGMQSRICTFTDLPLADVDRFELQVRPQEWVSFNNVSLEPGRKTDVQAVLDKE